MNTHRLKLYFEDGGIVVKLICVGECQPVTTCGDCGMDFTTEERCEVCRDEEPAPCWLAQWCEASDSGDVLEWLKGEVTIEVNGVFESWESPLIEVYEPDPQALLMWRAA